MLGRVGVKAERDGLSNLQSETDLRQTGATAESHLRHDRQNVVLAKNQQVFAFDRKLGPSIA